MAQTFTGITIPCDLQKFHTRSFQTEAAEQEDEEWCLGRGHQKGVQHTNFAGCSEERPPPCSHPKPLLTWRCGPAQPVQLGKMDTCTVPLCFAHARRKNGQAAFIQWENTVIEGFPESWGGELRDCWTGMCTSPVASCNHSPSLPAISLVLCRSGCSWPPCAVAGLRVRVLRPPPPAFPRGLFSFPGWRRNSASSGKLLSL